MKTKNYTRFFLTGLVLVISLLSTSLLLASSPAAQAQTASRPKQCKDTTPIDERALAFGAEYEWCRSHGGYAGGDATRCDDGTPISDGAQRGGREREFCESHLGWSVAGYEDLTRCDDGTLIPPGERGGGEKEFCESHHGWSAGEGKLQIDCKNPEVNESNCGIIRHLVNFIRIMSALVGIVVVIMITVGGIQYSTARDNPQATAAAKGRIFNALLALVAYLFMFAFLQWIIPGGVL